MAGISLESKATNGAYGDTIVEIDGNNVSREKISLEKVLGIIFTVIPMLGTILAIWVSVSYGISNVDICLLIVFYILTIIGIHIGFHRLFSHRSFKTSQVVKIILTILGSMAAQGPLIYWVSLHRRHHTHSDKDDDPHSPYWVAKKNASKIKGFWHAHVGWFHSNEYHGKKMSYLYALHASELIKDSSIERIARLHLFWVTLGLLIPALIGWVITNSAFGAFTGFLWGGLVRIFLVQNATWSLNSISHMYGTRPYKSSDKSTNNLLTILLTMGDGLHNNHHAFPNSSVLNFKWWQIDLLGYLLHLLKLLGVVWDLNKPNPTKLKSKENN